MKYYAFLWQRPVDKAPYPSIYESQELAEKAPFRISKVVEVDLEKENATDTQDRVGLGSL